MNGENKGPIRAVWVAYQPRARPLQMKVLAENYGGGSSHQLSYGMAKTGTHFTGVLFLAGLMITPKKGPKLIEYNVRFR